MTTNGRGSSSGIGQQATTLQWLHSSCMKTTEHLEPMLKELHKKVNKVGPFPGYIIMNSCPNTSTSPHIFVSHKVHSFGNINIFIKNTIGEWDTTLLVMQFKFVQPRINPQNPSSTKKQYRKREDDRFSSRKYVQLAGTNEEISNLSKYILGPHGTWLPWIHLISIVYHKVK